MYKNLTREMQNHSKRFQFLLAQGRSEFRKNMKVVARCSQSNDTETKNVTTLSSLDGIVVCCICKSVLKYDSRTTGFSHIKRHAENCKPCQSKYKQQLHTSHFNKKTLKLSESEKLAIKDAELQFRGYHSFNSLENEGLNTLIETFVNIAGKYGVFEVKDLLYSRSTQGQIKQCANWAIAPGPTLLLIFSAINY